MLLSPLVVTSGDLVAGMPVGFSPGDLGELIGTNIRRWRKAARVKTRPSSEPPASDTIEKWGPENLKYRKGSDPPSKDDLDKESKSSREIVPTNRIAVDPEVVDRQGQERTRDDDNDDVTMNRIAIEPEAVHGRVKEPSKEQDDSREDVTMKRVGMDPESDLNIVKLLALPSAHIPLPLPESESSSTIKQQTLALPPAESTSSRDVVTSTLGVAPENVLPPRQKLLLPPSKPTPDTSSSTSADPRIHALAILQKADEDHQKTLLITAPDAATSVVAATQKTGGAESLPATHTIPAPTTVPEPESVASVSAAAPEEKPAPKLAPKFNKMARKATPAAAPAATMALQMAGSKHALTLEDNEPHNKRSRTKVLIDERCLFAPSSEAHSYHYDTGTCNPIFDNNPGAFMSRKKVDSSKKGSKAISKPQKGPYQDPFRPDMSNPEVQEWIQSTQGKFNTDNAERYWALLAAEKARKDAEMEDGSDEKDTGSMYIEEVD